jgi:hypothetical protein
VPFIGGGVIVSAVEPTGSHPFKVTTSVVEGVAKYTIAKGSITDGTNGTAYDLEAEASPVIETPFTATAGHVIIKAGVYPDTLDIDEDSWAAAIVTAAEAAKEVVFNTEEPPGQIEVRLHIAKITTEGSPAVATAWQAWFTSARVVHAIVNGTAVRVFEAAPTHPTKI